MWTLIARRTLIAIPTVILVSMFVFGLQHALPGDPILVIAGEERDPEAIARLREIYRLNDPVPVQYVAWVGQALQGDFGQQYLIDHLSGLICILRIAWPKFRGRQAFGIAHCRRAFPGRCRPISSQSRQTVDDGERGETEGASNVFHGFLAFINQITSALSRLLHNGFKHVMDFYR